MEDKVPIQIFFKRSGETKNNYTFEQDLEGQEPMMFPKKIYLNKKLFKKEPKNLIRLEIQ